MRVKVTAVQNDMNITKEHTAKECITKVVPEGKKEMDWESFVRGYMK
jgi:hypothetical protein